MARFLVPQRSAVIRRQSTLEAILPEGHLARFIWRVLCSLDFADIEARYASIHAGPGRPPYHPRLLAALWIYGMTQGLEEATAIAEACRIRDDFRWLAGGLHPSAQTLRNFLAVAQDGLASVWSQVLVAMHERGHIDLSAIVEDGTKLRANASPRSFYTAAEIQIAIQDLEEQLASKLEKLGDEAQLSSGHASVRGLDLRLRRAKEAAANLKARIERRASRHRGGEHALREPRRAQKFGRADFQHDATRDVLVCPAGQDLRFIGVYADADRADSRYRLYRASNCSACPRRPQCTESTRRVVKIPLPATITTPAVSSSSTDASLTAAPLASNSPSAPGSGLEPAASSAVASTRTNEQDDGPTASITEPDAIFMLATSEKQWQPSYNADLAVTRHGVIVSQFLTTNPTDFPNFRRALPAVLSTLPRPDCWVGDGHYGSLENILLAHRAGVVLYAPPAGSRAGAEHASPATLQSDAAGEGAAGASAHEDATAPSRKFSRYDFRPVADRDALICPAGEELRFIGVYETYRLYGRSGCSECSLKPQCTDGRRRRVKVPLHGDIGLEPTVPITNDHLEAKISHADSPSTEPEPQDAAHRPPDPGEMRQLIQALEARMRDMGERVMKFRSQTCEPVNAQLKQHGLGRFHVRGVSRCSVVLTLACMAHNLMKWRAREAARVAVRLHA